MPNFTQHTRYPVLTGNCSSMSSKIRRAVEKIDAEADINERENAIANAVIAVSNVWLERDCSCSKCWGEYREAVRSLVS